MSRFSIALMLAGFLFLLTGFGHPPDETGPARIVIIRHGEKPAKGDNLSCAGLNRSLQLVPVLYRKIGIPDFVFTPALDLGRSTSTARMYQTIVPFAVKYNLKIDTKYDVSDTKELAHAIMKRSGTVLLVWEHKAAVKIVKDLGVPDELKWDDSDFDTILIITFQNGKPVLTMDSEHIHPAAACP